MKVHSTVVQQERHTNILNLCLQHLARCKGEYENVEGLLDQGRAPEAAARVDSLMHLIRTCPPPLDASKIVTDLKVRALIHPFQKCARPFTVPCPRFERQRTRTTRPRVLQVHRHHQKSLLHLLTILRTPYIGLHLFLDARGRTVDQFGLPSKRHPGPRLGPTNIGKRFRLSRVTFDTPIKPNTNTAASPFHPYTLQLHLHPTTPTPPSCASGPLCLVFLRTADDVSNNAPAHTGDSQLALPASGIPRACQGRCPA